MKESLGVYKRPTSLIVHAHLIRDVSHFNLNTPVIGKKEIYIYTHFVSEFQNKYFPRAGSVFMQLCFASCTAILVNVTSAQTHKIQLPSNHDGTLSTWWCINIPFAIL